MHREFECEEKGLSYNSFPGHLDVFFFKQRSIQIPAAVVQPRYRLTIFNLLFASLRGGHTALEENMNIVHVPVKKRTTTDLQEHLQVKEFRTSLY